MANGNVPIDPAPQTATLGEIPTSTHLMENSTTFRDSATMFYQQVVLVPIHLMFLSRYLSVICFFPINIYVF